ncbi:MAG: hypothetical protein QXG65_03865 [Thermoplasmata archaeon]
MTGRARLVPIPGAAALLLVPPADRPEPRTVLVADVHLGLGSSPAHPDGPPGAAGPQLAEQLIGIAERSGAASLVIAGDAKDPIPMVPRALRGPLFAFFSDLLRAGLSVDVILGNHDGGLAPHLPREVTVVPATGLVRAGVGIFHGHRWPSPQVLRCRQWVAGHLHPGVRLAPTPESPTGKQRCWVRVAFRRPPPAVPGRPWGAESMVVLPAFNPIAGTEALNRQRPARGRTLLYHRFLAHGIARAYLLDGTDLGPLPIGGRTAR